MSEPDHDELWRRIESGTPRGADVVWADAVASVQRLRRRRMAGAGLAVVVVLVGLGFLIGGDDGSDTTEVVSPPTTSTESSTDAEGSTNPTDDAEEETATGASELADILLMDLDAAVRELQAAGLVVEVVVGPIGDHDVVLATSPPPGDRVVAGDVVSVVAGAVPLQETPMRSRVEDLLLWQWDGAAGQGVALRRSELIAECMAEQGLPYEVWVQPPPDDQVGVIELARDGWGLVRRLIDGPVPVHIPSSDPNLIYLDSLTGAEKQDYGVTLDNCDLDAHAWQSPFNLEQQDLFAEVAANLGAGYAAVDADPAVREGLERYLGCLADVYGVEIDQFFEEHLIVTARLDDFTARNGEDVRAWSQGALEEVAELERFEHEVAFTVVACITEHYNPIRDAVTIEVEEAMVIKFADFLDALQDVVDRALG